MCTSGGKDVLPRLPKKYGGRQTFKICRVFMDQSPGWSEKNDQKNPIILILRPGPLCCPEVYRDVPGMLMMMMMMLMMIEDLQ